MTKHRPEFAHVQRTDTPDAETLVTLANRAGFIYAVPRTRALLDVLAKAGVLSKQRRYIVRDGKRKAMCRYTP